jgi:regulator of replication initiation timing
MNVVETPLTPAEVPEQEEKAPSPEERIGVLEEQVQSLTAKVERLSTDPLKIKIIGILLDLQRKISNFENFCSSVKTLKLLAAEIKDIGKDLEALEECEHLNLTSDELRETFATEYAEFLEAKNSLKNRNKLLDFISKFLTIRETGDEKYELLEHGISKREYAKVLGVVEFLEQEGGYFSKTKENLVLLVRFEEATENIINFMVNQ